MRKLIIIGLVATFMVACTAPEINEETIEYGIDKDKAVNSEGDSQDHELDDEFDNSED